jgi:hypothetical protein
MFRKSFSWTYFHTSLLLASCGFLCLLFWGASAVEVLALIIAGLLLGCSKAVLKPVESFSLWHVFYIFPGLGFLFLTNKYGQNYSQYLLNKYILMLLWGFTVFFVYLGSRCGGMIERNDKSE